MKVKQTGQQLVAVVLIVAIYVCLLAIVFVAPIISYASDADTSLSVENPLQPPEEEVPEEELPEEELPEEELPEEELPKEELPEEELPQEELLQEELPQEELPQEELLEELPLPEEIAAPEIDFADIGGTEPVIAYRGAPIYDNMFMPESAQLSAQYEFASGYGKVSGQVILPKPLIAAKEGRFEVIARDSAGNGQIVGEIIIGQDLSIGISYCIPTPEQQDDAPETFVVSFEIPCIFDMSSIPVPPPGALATVTLKSGGQTVTINLMPYMMPIQLRMSIGDELQDVVTVLDKSASGTGLYLGGKRLDAGAVVSLTDTMILRYDFELETAQISAIFQNLNTPIVIPVPDNLTWKADNSYLFVVKVNQSGTEYTVAEVRIIGGVAVISFTGDFWEQDLKFAFIEFAYFELPCRLSDEVAAAEPETCDIALLGGEDLTLFILEAQKSQHEIEKTGSVANDLFTWHITYTPGAVDSAYPLTIADSFDNSQHIFVPGSLTITRDGQEITGAADHVPGKTTINYEIAEYNPAPITISYQTRLADGELAGNPGADSVISNRVTVLDDKGINVVTPASKEITVNSKDKVWTQKTGAQNGRQISWTVTIHTLGRSLENLVIKDTMPQGLDLTTSSISLINLDTGSAADYSVIADSSKFEIAINDGPYAQKGYRLTYTTVIDDDYFDKADSGSFTNKAEVDFAWHKYNYDGEIGATVPTSRPATYMLDRDSNVVHKSGVYNRATHEITWTVIVNSFRVDVLFGTITDDLSSRGQTYVDGSFNNSANPLITLDEDASTDKKLIVKVGNIGANSYSYSFKTTVDDAAVYAGNDDYDEYNQLKGRYYSNLISFVGDVQVASSVNHVTSSATGQAWVSSRMLDKESVSYNYNTHKITWRVTINHNNMPLKNVVLTDVAPEGQTFVAGSVSITPSASFTADYDTAQTLSINIPTVNAQTVVTYQTIVDPDLIDDFKTELLVELGNSITLDHDALSGVTGAATIEIENNIVDKNGVFDSANKVISYTVTINPNGLTINDATVSDIIPEGLQLDITSVTLMNATVNASGSFAEAGEKYSYDSLDANTGNTPAFSYSLRGFVLHLPNGNQSYILKYDCYITDASQGPFVNDVQLNDTSGISGDTATSEDETDVGSSGTGVSGKRVQLNITKVDEMRTGVVLSGIEFKLYQKIGADKIHIMTGTTDTNGRLSFYPLKQGAVYVLEEAPDQLPGYEDANIKAESTADVSVIKPANALELTINKDGGATELTVTNFPQLGSIQFTKRTDRLSKGVFQAVGAGEAKFRITDQTPNSDFVAEVATNAAGQVIFNNVPPFGDYLVEEIVTPQYHTPAASFTVTINADGTTVGGYGLGGVNTVDNVYFRPDFTITKTEADGTVIPGVTFELYEVGVSLPVEAVTGPDGKATFVDLYGGKSYVIKEKGTPLTDHYTTGEYTVGLVNQAADYSYTWKNYVHAASLEVTKVDEMRTGVLLSGATFELRRDNAGTPGAVVATQTTSSFADATFGKTTFTGLALNQTGALTTASEPTLSPTVYWLVEKTAPTGYNLPAAPIQVTLDTSFGGATPRTATYTATVENEPVHHGSVNLTFTKNSNKQAAYTLGSSPLQGVQFTMTDQTTGSNLVRTTTSDDSGEVKFTNIPFGRYTIAEVAPATNHKALDAFEVEFNDAGECIEFNGVSSPTPDKFVIVNQIFDPSLVITKTKADGNTPIDDVTFELCDASGNSFLPQVFATTQNGGKATFSGLLGGDSYVVKEVGTPLTGYYKSGEYLIGPIDKEANYAYTWPNYEHAAAIEVTKVDAMRNGVKVPGTVFDLYRDNGFGAPGAWVAMQTTDASGVATFSGLDLMQDTGTLTTNAEPTLIPTDYWLVEKTPSAGYLVNTAQTKVTLTTRTETQKVTIQDSPVTCDIEFTKYTDRDAGATLAGAVFKITDQTAGSTYTRTAVITAADGKVSFTNVPHGRYLVQETTTPQYHNKAADFYLTVDKAGKVVEFGAAADASGLTGPFSVTNNIKKTSLTITKQDALGAPLSGVWFELYRVVASAETLVGLAQKTDAYGVVTFSGLMGGEEYLVKEVGTPLSGYYQSGEYLLTIANPDIVGGYAHIWKNYAHAASIEVSKVDELRPGVLLSGATFALYHDNGAGAPGELVSTQTTSSVADATFGKITFSGLALTQNTATLSTASEPALLATDYWLVETVAPNGYELDTAPIRVTLNPSLGGATPRTYTYPVLVTNEPTEHDDITLTFTKTSNKQAAYTLGSRALSGVLFRMTDLTPGSHLVWTTTSNGSGIVEFKDIPFGRYKIEEVDADDNVSAAQYHQSPAVFEVEFNEAGQCIEFNGINDPTEANGDFVIVNQIFAPSLVITKTKADGSTPIDGVTFNLCKEDGEVISSATTQGGGTATFSGLLGGDSYVVKEVGSPLTGYYKTGEYRIGPINQQGDYTYSWPNYEHAASLEVTKLDAVYAAAPVSGATFELYSDAGLSNKVGSGITDAYGKITFSGLALDQDMTALATDPEPTLLSTDYWLVETGKAVGYTLDTTPIKVTLNPTAAGTGNPRTYTYTHTVTNAPEYVNINYTTHNLNPADTNAGGSVSLGSERITVVVQNAAGSSATASPGYEFVGWFKEGDNYATGTPLQTAALFSPARVGGLNVAGSYVAVFREQADVSITYAPKTIGYQGAAQTDNLGGSITSNGETPAPVTGTALGSVATAAAGYTFIGWFAATATDYTGTPLATTTAFIPAKDGANLNITGSYVAVFREQANVSITYAPKSIGYDGTPQTGSFGGSVSSSGEALAPATGTAAGSIAAANAGYTFIGWFTASATDYTGTPLATATAFIPAKDGANLNVTGSYVAVFQENTDIAITYRTTTVNRNWASQMSDNQGGSISVVSENAAPFTGAPESVASANPGYEFVGWFSSSVTDYENGLKAGTTETFTPARVGGLNAAGSYIAVFREQADVSIIYAPLTVGSDWAPHTPVNQGGNVSVSSENVPPATGTAQGSIALANAGYTFIGWFDSSATDYTSIPLATTNTFTPAKNGENLNMTGSYVAIFKENDKVTVAYAPKTVGNNWAAQAPDNQGGSVTSSDEALDPVTGTAQGSTATAKVGYTFIGWFDSSATDYTGTPLQTASKLTPVKVGGLNVAGSYVAVFRENADVEITYASKTVRPAWVVQTPDDLGGSVSVLSEDVAPFTGAPESVATAKVGYSFVGWFASSETDYQNGTKAGTTETFTPARVGGLNVAGSYVAVFRENSGYTVVYDVNDPDVSQDPLGSIVQKDNQNWTSTGLLPAVAQSKHRYIFKGWLVTDGGNSNRASGHDYVLNTDNFGYLASDTVGSASGGSITLAAQWEKVAYTVKYDTNGAMPLEIAPRTVTWDSLKLLPSATLTRPGYTLVGWRVSENGSEEDVSAADAYKELASDDVNTYITLQAKWQENDYYRVKYDTNGSAAVIADAENIKWTDVGLVPFPIPVRSGYTFIGWNVSENGVGLNVQNTAQYGELALNDRTLYITLQAQWNETGSYAVKYDVNGATSGLIATKTGVKWNNAALLPASDPTRTGYIFTGWLVAENGHGMATSASTFASLAQDDTVTYITLQAQWDALDAFIVKYDINGATSGGIADKTGLTWADSSLLPADPTRTGYIFTGWNVKENGNFVLVNDYHTYGELAFAQNPAYIVLQAQWVPDDEYAVKYDLNGAQSAMISDRTVASLDTAGLLPSQQPARAGYSLTGWNVSAHGYGENVGNQDKYGDLADIDPQAMLYIVLQAQWEERFDYAVRYDANGGTPSIIPARNNVSWAEVNLLPAVSLTRSGYNFVGWNVSFNGRGQNVRPSQAYGDLANNDQVEFITLQAQWQSTGGNNPPPSPVPPSTGGRSYSLKVQPAMPGSPLLNTEDHFAYVFGYPDGTVHPEGKIIRAEVSAILFRLLKDDIRNANLTSYNAFPDVSEGQWFNNSTSTVTKLRIIEGYPDGTFKPGNNITRAEFVALVARFLNSADGGGDMPYTDVADGHWAAEYILCVYNAGVITGYEDGTFRPQAPISRAEVMSILNNLLNRHVESADDLLPGMVTWSDNAAPDAWYYYDVQEATNSHKYERKEDGRNEKWKAILPNKD